VTAAAHGPSALWYATRGAGAVTTVLLTASLVLGICESAGWRPGGASRFATAALHRTLSLAALAMLAVHIATTLLDPFPPIGAVASFVPFAGPYRRLWLGLGVVASDVLIALVLTSLLRRRLGYRLWRATHWAAYGCWPVAVLHGLGTGSDVKSTWLLVLTAACVGAVMLAVIARLAAAAIAPGARTGAFVASAAAVIGLFAWLQQGPLARGWARRAGTPAAVLAAFSPRVTRAAARVDPLARPFDAALTGSLRNGSSAGGMAVVDVRARLTGGPRGVVRLRLGGLGLPGGGLRMQRSAVTLGPPGRPGEYQGRVQVLRDSVVQALLGSSDGRAIRLTMALQVTGDGAVSGRVRGIPITRRGA